MLHDRFTGPEELKSWDDVSIGTWEDLAKAILALPDEQRRQPVQCCPPTGSDEAPVELLPGIALGTVMYFGLCGARSTHDNKFRADDVVLLMDHNAFAEDGAIAYEWLADESGSSTDHPIYGPGGPTTREDQMAPR